MYREEEEWANCYLKSPFQAFKTSIKPSFQASIIAHAVKEGVLARIKGCPPVHWLRSRLHMQPSRSMHICKWQIRLAGA